MAENEFSSVSQHATQHNPGGTDEVTGGGGGPHAVTHEAGGSDPVSNIDGALVTLGDDNGTYISINQAVGVGSPVTAIAHADGSYAFRADTAGTRIGGPSGTGQLGALLSFFDADGVVQADITGALSAVTDAAAKAVLTSIIALADGVTGYNLVTDSTT
jgi:hypothetical protein